MKTRVVTIVILILFFIVAVGAYQYLPPEVAMHWNKDGYADSASKLPKLVGILVIPTIAVVLFLLFILLMKIDPLKRNIKEFSGYYDQFVLVFTIFLFYVYSLMIIWNMKIRFNMNYMLIPALGIFFLYIGFIFKKLKRNWFIGIRTPWTISDDTVWKKTHEKGSILFVINGIIIIGGMLFYEHIIWFIFIPLGFTLVYLFIYSYLEYVKIHESGNHKNGTKK